MNPQLKTEVIPVINCDNFECVKLRINQAASFFNSAGGWIHLDISDGQFTPRTTWDNPQELKNFLESNQALRKLRVEVNLMVKQPEEVIEEWLKIGVQRMIVSFESLKDLKVFSRLCRNYGVQPMLSLSPQISFEKIEPQLSLFDGFNILAVNPGFSGQNFQKSVLEKIRILRQKKPDAIIEVDGGINLETAKLAKAAGANLFAASSFIFDAADPKKAYLDLAKAVAE